MISCVWQAIFYRRLISTPIIQVDGLEESVSFIKDRGSFNIDGLARLQDADIEGETP
jgi:hypothetical protein